MFRVNMQLLIFKFLFHPVDCCTLCHW